MDGKKIASLSDAIESAIATGGTVTLRGNGKNSGISVPENTDFTLNLNGYKLELQGPGAGSEGTKTQGMQLLKGSHIVIKNGTIDAKDTPEIKMLIQNYADLTLDNVHLIGSNNCQYLCSNNYGTVRFINGTTFDPVGTNVAFDAWYGLDSLGSYDYPGVHVHLDDTVVVNGKVEFGKQGRASNEDFANGCSITVPSSYNLPITLSSTITGGTTEWVDNNDGTKSYKYIPN